MKPAVASLLFVAACLLLTPSASATWGSFVSTGSTTGVGNPSCAGVSTGDVVCAVRSGKDVMMVNEYSGSKWGKWTSLAGAVSSDPSCTSDGAGNVICAANAAGSLLTTIFNGTTWSKPAKVTGALYSAPSCGGYTAGQVLCAARSSDGSLAWTLYNGTTWSKFATVAISTASISAPACTTDNNDGVICSIYTTTGVTQVNRFVSGAWEGFLNIGGTAGGEPECTSLNSGGKVACFAKSYLNGIYGSEYNPGSSWALGDWGAYGSLGGNVNENAGCTTQGPGLLVCGVIGATDNVFYGDVWNGSSWSGWAKIGGSGVGSPSCAPLGGDEVICTVMGPNNELTSVVGP